MTRYECETKILSLLDQIKNIYKEYSSAGGFLSATIDVDTDCTIVSDCFFTETNGVRAIVQDVNGFIFQTVDAAQYKDGKIRVANRRIKDGKSV